MNFKIFIAVSCILAIAALPATSNAYDPGVPDTVDMVFSVVPDAATSQLQVQIDLWCFSDSVSISGATMGFSWDNPNLQMDSARSTPVTESPEIFQLGPYFYDGNSRALTNANLRFIFGASRISGPGVVPADTRRHWASYFFTMSEWSINDSIVLDTLQFGSESVYKFVGDGVGSFFPVWTVPMVIHDPSYVPPVILSVEPDSLFFTGIVGGSNPAAQTFQIAVSSDPINFQLVENIDWIIPSPVLGHTPQTVTVMTNITGMTEGVYVDSIRVNVAAAENSPQYVVVCLTLKPPPPTIDVSAMEFYFNAVAGGADPAPRTLTIKNAGGLTLNWTVSNTESWLDLNPHSGTDSSDVTLSVDITGLAYNDYYDTVVVSDPNATNDPVRIPVFLSVGSALPIIHVDSAFNTIIVDIHTSWVPRTILIGNAGAGTLNFWLQEDSPRLFTLNPSSGTAPEQVSVGFKLFGVSAGEDYRDTLWVHSNEAIDSPFPVVFFFHVVDNAAELHTNRGTLRLTMFECSMGWHNDDLPSESFVVGNLGGDNPLAVKLLYESDYFTVTPSMGVASVSFTVDANYLQLPVGTYYDTILVSAWKAPNSPDTVIVVYEIIEGIEDPEIVLTATDLVVCNQQNTGLSSITSFGVQNAHSGCMEWELVEDIPWLFPLNTSGNVPGWVAFRVNTAGVPMGEHLETLLITAADAVNSPQPVSVLLKVWLLHGDLDYDGLISISDLVYMVDYMFNEGPEPRPELVVADMNCDRLVGVDDLVYLVDYMFNEGPIPCGNPY